MTHPEHGDLNEKDQQGGVGQPPMTWDQKVGRQQRDWDEEDQRSARADSATWAKLKWELGLLVGTLVLAAGALWAMYSHHRT